jgi:DNA-binding transcriptional ArsR family regulator
LNSEDAEPAMDKIFNAISHQTRRQIVQLIGNHGSASYTDLTSLKLEPGRLYFHLDTLTKTDDPLVEQAEDKRYSLTKLGQVAYEFIQQGVDEIQLTKAELATKKDYRTIVAKILGFTPITKRVQSDPRRYSIEVILLLGVYGYLSSTVGLLPVLMFILDSSFDVVASILAAFAAWIGTYLMVELLSNLVLGKREFSSGLLLSVPLCFAPYVLVEVVWAIMPTSQALIGWPLTVLLAVTISWSTYILTCAVARSRRIREARAAIPALVCTNVNLLVLFILTSILQS